MNSLLKSSGIDTNVSVLDIGTGASCIYPLLGHQVYDWDFVATDILGKSNTLRFVFEIGVFTPGIEDVVFSENTFNYIIIGIVILVVVAVFVTRRLKT